MKRLRILPVILALTLMLSSCGEIAEIKNNLDSTTKIETTQSTFTLDDVPEYDGHAYIEINNNIPDFTKADYTTTSFEEYGPLDYLGRCTTAYACIGKDLMPTEERGSIGSVKPTGWQTVKYNNVDGKYLYNRCHLIGYQLTAENANECNLITGTRYLNITGMLGFEDNVADYIKSTSNHVLYRVTPIFNGKELVARGVQMEAYSVEDNGDGICYNVYCYNVQPNIEINYLNGDSRLISAVDHTDEGEKQTYIINMKTKKFHTQKCSSVEDISTENKKAYIGYRTSLINNGFSPCSRCKP